MENNPLFPIRIDQPQEAQNLCFTLTTRCNLNCDYCFNWETRPYDMRPELAYDLYTAYAGLRTTGQTAMVSVILFGGEPTLNYTAIQQISRAAAEQRHKMLPRLVTNGVIDDALLEKLLNDMYYFQISYDGDFSARMDGEKGQVVRRTIQRVSEAGLPLFLRSTIHSGNVGKMVAIVKEASRCGADTIGFAPVALMGNAARNAVSRPPLNEYVENFIKALETALELGVNVYSAEINYLGKQGRGSPAPTLVFLPDGSISYSIKFCSAASAGAQDLIIGNYDAVTRSLVFYWERINQRAAIFTANQSSYCGGCTALSLCRSLNLFDYLSVQQNPGKLDNYYCDITRALLKRLEAFDLSANMAF